MKFQDQGENKIPQIRKNRRQPITDESDKGSKFPAYARISSYIQDERSLKNQLRKVLELSRTLENWRR